jgi:hypothetical protein
MTTWKMSISKLDVTLSFVYVICNKTLSYSERESKKKTEGQKEQKDLNPYPVNSHLKQLAKAFIF